MFSYPNEAQVFTGCQIELTIPTKLQGSLDLYYIVIVCFKISAQLI